MPIDLPPQWHANTFGIDATGSGKTLHLESAWPALYSPPTPPGGLDLEAVYAGFGTEADYHHTDVRRESGCDLQRAPFRHKFIAALPAEAPLSAAAGKGGCGSD